MTYDEFLKRLRRSRRRWHLVDVNGQPGWILAGGFGKEVHSPISAVARRLTGKSYRARQGRHRNPCDSHEAMQDLRLAWTTELAIERASMGEGKFEKRIRDDLLAATHIKTRRTRSRWVFGF